MRKNLSIILLKISRVFYALAYRVNPEFWRSGIGIGLSPDPAALPVRILFYNDIEGEKFFTVNHGLTYLDAEIFFQGALNKIQTRFQS